MGEPQAADGWTEAIVSAIPKPEKDPSKPVSKANVSPQRYESKIFENIILKRMDKHTEEFNIIPSFIQFVFRRFQTSHQAFRLARHAKVGFSNKMSTGMILFDGEKAFDLVRPIQSFLEDRSFKVKVNQALNYPVQIRPLIISGFFKELFSID